MCYLLIDIGNSYTKYAMYDGGILSPVEKVVTALFKRDVALLTVTAAKPQGILLVSVANKQSTDKIVVELGRMFHCSIQQIKTRQSDFGVTCGYQDYSLLGADRWVAMLGAFHRPVQSTLPEPIIVIDCGSVVTVDVIDTCGQHLGGWMMPDTQLLTASLGQKADGIKKGLQNTDKISADVSCRQNNLPGYGHSTRECIEFGGQLAVSGFIEQCVARVQSDCSPEPRCILSGGGAEDIISLLSMRVEYRPNLVFDGLALFTE